MPGVLAAFTAADLPASARQISDRLPPALAVVTRPVLADRFVRHLGEPLAIVVGEDEYVAADGALAVDVELEALPAVGTLGAALSIDAPLVHSELGSNVGLWGTDGYGDVEAAFNAAATTVRDRLSLARVAGGALEPRSVLARPKGDGVELWSSTQAVYRVRQLVAEALEIGLDRVVVRALDVGGGFGPKGRRYPEDVLAAWTAMRLGRPVRWVAGRSEEGATATQAHGSIFDLELAADQDGRLTGLRGAMWHDIGAYPSIGATLPGAILRHMLCTYRVPALAFEAYAVFTNTVTTGTVRGGPGTEGIFAIERMMDLLAAQLGLSPAEVRRRNILLREDLPYTVQLAESDVEVDGIDLATLLNEAEGRVGAPTQAEDGRLRGVGVAFGVELLPTLFRAEPARLRIQQDGIVEAFIGSSPQGQGHETMAAQIVASRLGWPVEQIRVRASDTTQLEAAGPTASSRSAVSVGNALAQVARAARQTLLDIAADTLQVDASRLELEQGWVVSADPDPNRWPAVDFLSAQGVDVTDVWHADAESDFSATCHAVEVAVDPGTGDVSVQRYAIAYDAGVVINPAIVDGQLTGGATHGVAYSLFEEVIYDERGQLLTPSFLDYLIPGPTEIVHQPTLIPCPIASDRNPEGIKGAGELGVIAAPAAVVSAIESALRQVAPELRIAAIPVRPETIVQLLSRSR